MLLHAPGLPTRSGFAPAAPEPPALTVAHGRCTGRGLAAHPNPSQSYQGSEQEWEKCSACANVRAES